MMTLVGHVVEMGRFQSAGKKQGMVQAGAVALAAGMTAIYPDDGPGGWHVIGHCDPGFCKRLAIGDRIQWEAIT